MRVFICLHWLSCHVLAPIFALTFHSHNQHHNLQGHLSHKSELYSISPTRRSLALRNLEALLNLEKLWSLHQPSRNPLRKHFLSRSISSDCLGFLSPKIPCATFTPRALIEGSHMLESFGRLHLCIFSQWQSRQLYFANTECAIAIPLYVILGWFSAYKPY